MGGTVVLPSSFLFHSPTLEFSVALSMSSLLYEHVLEQKLGSLGAFARARHSKATGHQSNRYEESEIADGYAHRGA